MGPSVESSQNRSVFSAGAPRREPGMVSSMDALLTLALVAVDGSLEATLLPARMRGAGVASSAAGHLTDVPCVTSATVTGG
jgi:hypothetical protein